MATSAIAPTPAPAAPAPSGPGPTAPPGASVNSVLDSAFSHAAEAAPATPAPDAPAPDPGAAITSPETPVVDPAAAAPLVDPAAPTDPAAAAAPTEEPLDLSDVAPDSIDAEGKRHFFSVAKSNRLQQAGKFVQALQDVMPAGALTVDSVKERIERANAVDDLINIYESSASDPAGVKHVVEMFKTNRYGELTPEIRTAFSNLAFEALTQLPQINPQAWRQVIGAHNQITLKALQDTARQTTDPTARQTNIALALRFEQWMTGGKWTPTEQWLNGQQVDPIEAGRQQLERDRAAFNQQQQQAQQARQQQWATHVGTSQDTAQLEEVNSQLKTVASKPEFAPYLDKMRGDLIAAVRKSEQEHPEWENGWKSREQQALMYPTPQNLKAVTDYRRNIARDVARRNAAQVIGFYSNVVLNSNQAAHARAGQAVASEPTSNGVASAPTNGIKIDDAVKAKGWDGVMNAMGW